MCICYYQRKITTFESNPTRGYFDHAWFFAKKCMMEFDYGYEILTIHTPRVQCYSVEISSKNLKRFGSYEPKTSKIVESNPVLRGT